MRASEPGTGLYLHTAYARLKETTNGEKDETPAAPTTTFVRPSYWNVVCSHAERQREVLEILAERHLTIGALSGVLGQKHLDIAVYDSQVRSIVNGPYKDRELDREPETFRKTQTRFRYFKRTALDGPIVQLEETFNQVAGDA